MIPTRPERLFEAWTKPELLQQWWGPAGVRRIAAEVDLRAGGRYRIGNQLPDGRGLWITGEFELVESPHRLVVHHERVHSMTVRDDHERGWHGCLDGLARWCASRMMIDGRRNRPPQPHDGAESVAAGVPSLRTEGPWPSMCRPRS